MPLKIPQFELYRSWGRWRWRLRAVNGEIIAQGQGYRDQRSCFNTICEIQRTDQDNSKVVYL